MPAKTRHVLGDLPFIGRPAAQALEAAGVTKLAQIARRTEDELLAMHGVGPKAIRILREALAERGLAFKAARRPGTR